MADLSHHSANDQRHLRALRRRLDEAETVGAANLVHLRNDYEIVSEWASEVYGGFQQWSQLRVSWIAAKKERDEWRIWQKSGAGASLDTSDLFALERILYNGGVVPRKSGGGRCASSQCGGATYCLHRHVAAPNADAVLAWRIYEEPLPIGPSDSVEGARNAIKRLFDAHAPPSDVARCGGTVERLAVLGLTIDDLVRNRSLLIEHVIPALSMDWNGLLALGFHVSLLKYRRAYPVSVLAAEPIGMSAEKLMATFSFDYEDIATLTQEELYVLGFTAPLLVSIGMRGIDVLDAFNEPTTHERGVQWWVKAMNYSAALHAELFRTTRTVDIQSIDGGSATYTSLTLHTRR